MLSGHLVDTDDLWVEKWRKFNGFVLNVFP